VTRRYEPALVDHLPEGVEGAYDHLPTRQFSKRIDAYYAGQAHTQRMEWLQKIGRALEAAETMSDLKKTLTDLHEWIEEHVELREIHV